MKDFLDCLIYLPRENILVIGDVHIGLEEAMNKQGWLISRHVYPEIKKRIKKQLDKIREKKPKIILIGDIKHEFGRISEQEWTDTLDFIDFLAKYGELILLKGNHDKVLGPIANKKQLEVLDYYKQGTYLFMHGDKLPTKKLLEGIRTIIIGHEHPAVSLREGAKEEKYKCFLVGKWKGKELVVVPSVHTLTEGTDILKEKLLSPFLKNIKDFKVYIVGDKVYEFGSVKEIQEME